MKITILGAGLVGSAIARDLAKEKNFVFSVWQKHPSGNISDCCGKTMFKLFKEEHDEERKAEKGNRYQDVSRSTSHSVFFYRIFAGMPTAVAPLGTS